MAESSEISGLRKSAILVMTLVLAGAFGSPSHAGSITRLASFNGARNGANMFGGVTLSGDGSTLYGTAGGGGAYGDGTIFAYDLTQPVPEPPTFPILMACICALVGVRVFRDLAKSS